MAARVRVTTYLTLYFLLVLSICFGGFLFSCHGAGEDDPVISSAGTNHNLLGLKRNNPVPNCGEMASRSACLQSTKCRWCRSDAIDDMCFSSAEAWRLPQQVFSCD